MPRRLDAVTIRDAFYVATHKATRTADSVRIDNAAEADAAEAESLVLHDGRIHFQGHAAELLASADPYIKEFLYNTQPPW